MAAATEGSIDVRDHGMSLDKKKGRVQCNYCGKVVSGFFRLKCHLGGIRGDVIPCENAPQKVREQFRDSLLERKTEGFCKEVGEPYHLNLPQKRHCCPNLNSVEHNKHEIAQNGSTYFAMHVDIDSSTEDTLMDTAPCPNGSIGSQAAINCESRKYSSSSEAQKCIARFFYETGVDLSAANSPSFKRMINATLGHGQTEYNIPSCQELKGWMLNDEIKEMQRYVKNIRHSWASTGCSVLLDGWIDEKGRHLVNFLVDCPQGAVYLRSSDVTSFISDVDILQSLLDGIIEEIGVDNVVQVVACSTKGWVGDVGKQFVDRCKRVVWTVSASHCIELMLEKIGMIESIKRILNEAKTIIKFIYGHETVLSLLKKHTLGCDLIKPSTRLAMPFMTLENIVSEKQHLKDMFASSEWKTSFWASRIEGKRVADLVGDQSFWNGIGNALKATTPLVRVLFLIKQADKPQVGYIYETMDQVKETIKEEFKKKKPHYMPFWQVIDEIWDTHLHSPIHAAGYYLNPSLFYSSDFFGDAEVAFGLLSSIVRLVQDQRSQDMISRQLEEYRHARGSFEEGSALDQRTNMPPALWWSRYGRQYPELQRFAIRILSQNCDGASRYALKRSLAEKLVTTGRNPIEQKRLNDLAFVHYNLQLQQFQSGTKLDIVAEEIDPMDDWIVDQAPETVFQNGLFSWINFDTYGEGPSNIRAKKEPW
ncbi:hypothetical protein F2P56_027824 [Juglans regia]|uniref:Uncharacterized protein LOC109005000 isoform X1 n=2 Tax=Juglans regia TaxID=51240 RepID=A0A2I4G5V4_JUGRE|nr:uncharacterized protein LOC109005000 isoform X1 [Juglans regia]XP_018839286.1 uncharacterized protein LOC109005000 isoform X1 [Juglans regia]KAF5452866.1 hypothetical protein F2P56_027824 [Juglans regia]